MFQGTGQTNTEQFLHYTQSSITTLSDVTNNDGSQLVARRTVARDLNIISATGVLIDVDQIGTKLLANDTGGAISGYRLDLFNGAGIAACANFTNPICVPACETAQPLCPSTEITNYSYYPPCTTN
jgi:3D (Asp-Asp-Asp) domain-containing protein